MGRNPTGQRKYQIQGIWDTHHEILRRLLLGNKSKDIAEDLGVTEAVVSYTKNSHLVQRQLEVMRGARDKEVLDASIEIKRLIPKALAIYEEALENEDHPFHIRLRAAGDLLDREVPRKTRVEGVHALLSREDIEEIKNRARMASNFIEAEVVAGGTTE